MNPLSVRSFSLVVGTALVATGVSIYATAMWLSDRRRKKAIGAEDTSQESCSIADGFQLVAVNYHFTRECNYACGFCFHTAKNSDVLPLEDSKFLLSELRRKGCNKINFAGGEPFLPKYQDMLGEMVKFCKQDCGYKSVSIISNAHFIDRSWFEKYAKYLDILGVSCDSAIDKVNKRIGRGRGDHTKHVRRAAALCLEFNIEFKLNTVVTSWTWSEDMSALVNDLQPMRWKIFQALRLEGENFGEGAKRNVANFLIDEDKLQHFVEKHKAAIKNPEIMRVEDNTTMQSSYVLVDEHGCFLDSSTGGKKATESIINVGIDTALAQLLGSSGAGFDHASFIKRDGAYNMSLLPTASTCDSCGVSDDIEDM